MELIISVLVPSVPERMLFLTNLVGELSKQANSKPVEIIVLLDNRCRTLGAKRNLLLKAAQGRYVTFVDDDDRVEPDYIEQLLNVLLPQGISLPVEDEPDCVVFDAAVNFNGEFRKICKSGKEYENSEDETYYYRKPAHLMCYAKRIAIRHEYADISYGEDIDWSTRASPDIVRQVRIQKVLYHYDYVNKPSTWWVGKN